MLPRSCVSWKVPVPGLALNPSVPLILMLRRKVMYVFEMRLKTSREKDERGRARFLVYIFEYHMARRTWVDVYLSKL